MENTYQFRLSIEYPVHTGVKLNAPYDRYGYVVAIKDTNEKGVLHLIRGTGTTQRFPYRIEL